MESAERLKLPFEPEVVQVLLKNALKTVQGKEVPFVALRQAAMYVSMYWGTARFEEVIAIKIRQIAKKRCKLRTFDPQGGQQSTQEAAENDSAS